MNILQDRIVKFLFNKRYLTLSLSLLIMLIFFIQMFGKASRKDGWDFSSYLLSSIAFFNGTNPYATGSIFPFVYPLFACVILYPLASVPYWIASVVWFFLSTLALCFSTLTVFRLYDSSLTYKDIAALFFIPFIILVDVIQNNFLNGQINIIVLFLCILFFKYSLESRRLVASLLLSAAISIKLTPAIFLLYLIIRRDFLSLVLTLVFLAVFIFALPYAIAGHKTVEWYSQYIQSFLVYNIASRGEVSDEFGYSITAIFSHFFPLIPKLLSFLLASLVSILPIVWVHFTSQKDERTKQAVLLSLYSIAFLLVTPMTETHHLINLLPAICIITLVLTSYARNNFQISFFTLAIVFVSLLLRKFHIGTAIIGILATYVSMLWIFIQPSKRATAYNKQNTDAPFVEREL